MTAPTCGTCRWWQGNRECRRMPPMGMVELAAVPRGGSVLDVWKAQWPMTKATDWCGEYTSKGEFNGQDG